MFAKRWSVVHDDASLTLVHETRLSMRTRVSLFADGVLLARTPWRIHLVPVTLRTLVPDSGAVLEATAGYARNGFTRVHRLRVNGHLVSGIPEVPDLMSETHPENGYLYTVLVRGAPPAIIYTLLMFIGGVFTPQDPGAALMGGGIFWFAMGSYIWLMARWVAANRRRAVQEDLPPR